MFHITRTYLRARALISRRGTQRVETRERAHACTRAYGVAYVVSNSSTNQYWPERRERTREYVGIHRYVGINALFRFWEHIYAYIYTHSTNTHIHLDIHTGIGALFRIRHHSCSRHEIKAIDRRCGCTSLEDTASRKARLKPRRLPRIDERSTIYRCISIRKLIPSRKRDTPF